MFRKLILVALALTLASLAQAQDPDPRLVIDLRNHNTAELHARGQERALMASGTLTKAGSDALLTFASQTRASTVFVDLPELTGTVGPRVLSQFRWREFLGRLHRQGLQVYAIAPHATPQTRYSSLVAALDYVVGFGQLGLPGESFDGLLIPDPGFTAPRTSSQEDFAGPETGTSLGMGTDFPEGAPRPLDAGAGSEVISHLNSLLRFRNYYETRYPDLPLKIGAALPVWLTGRLYWGGSNEPAFSHFLRFADFLVGNNVPFSTADIGSASRAILAEAGAAQVPVYLQLEVRPVTTTSNVDAAVVMRSLHGRDQLFVEQLMSDVISQFGDLPGLGGFVINDWIHYRAMPTVRSMDPATVPAAPIIGPRSSWWR